MHQTLTLQIRLILVLCILLLAISFNSDALWANNNTVTLSGSVGHTAAFTLTGGDFSAESWIGLTDAAQLSGGDFTLMGGQVAETPSFVSAVEFDAFSAETPTIYPLILSIFLMLLTGVVTLRMLHRDA